MTDKYQYVKQDHIFLKNLFYFLNIQGFTDISSRFDRIAF